MHQNLLTGLRVLDLTHRLPGPLAGKILSDLGCEVIKIEDEQYKDPFLSGMFSHFDTSFKDWYQNINQNKKIERLSFNDPAIKNKIRSYLETADGVLLSLSDKLKEKLGLSDRELSTQNLAVIELDSSSVLKKAMHDLNALAESGFLSLHIKDETSTVVAPPFLPIAGISFGQHIATTLLASIIKAQKSKAMIKEKCYLHDTAVEIYQPFWSDKLREEKRVTFLHNGAYPCYSLYKTADQHYVALAAVEEKFWNNFCETFNVSLSSERRFESSPEAFKEIINVFGTYTSENIEQLSKGKDLCLSIVRKI